MSDYSPAAALAALNRLGPNVEYGDLHGGNQGVVQLLGAVAVVRWLLSILQGQGLIVPHPTDSCGTVAGIDAGAMPGQQIGRDGLSQALLAQLRPHSSRRLSLPGREAERLAGASPNGVRGRAEENRAAPPVIHGQRSPLEPAHSFVIRSCCARSGSTWHPAPEELIAAGEGRTPTCTASTGSRAPLSPST